MCVTVLVIRKIPKTDAVSRSSAMPAATARALFQNSKRRYGKTFLGSFNMYKVNVDEKHVLDPRIGTSWLLPHQNGETFRLWVARNLELSPLMRGLDALMVVLSFVMVAFFLYTNWNSYSIDLDPAVQMYATPLRLEYVTSVFSLVDLIGVASAWIEICLSKRYMAILKIDTMGRQFLSMLQVMKSLRVLRAYRLLRFTSSMVQRQILATVLTVLCMIIAVAGALQNLELCPAQCPDICIPLYRNDTMACVDVEITFADSNATTTCPSFVNHLLEKALPPTNCCRCQVYRFLDWIYFVVVTISTLGYGDISPKTASGRFGTAILIMMTFVFVPIQVNKLVTVISQHSKYNKAYTSRSDTHAVITAHQLDVSMLHAFLRQFFHPQNRNWNERVCETLPLFQPSADVTKIIHLYEPRVTYIVGSAMQEADLKRAAVPTSAICYVLTSCAGDRSGRADQMSAILTTAFRVMNKTVPIFTQVIASTSVSYCTISGATNVVCVQKLKMSMLALSCGIKGLTTLLTNLLSTLSPPSKPAKEPWMAEYLQGAMSKIFRVDIPRSFSGITYHELVMFLYNNLQVIPIAMEMGNGIQLNPMSFKLGQAADPKLCCTVYVIAPNLQVIDRINEYQHEQIREFRQTLRKMERAKADAEGADNKSPKSAKKQKKKFTLGGHVFRSNSHDTAGFDIKAAYDLFMAKDLPTVLDGHIVVVGLPFALQDLLDPLHTKSSSQIVVIFSPVKMAIPDFERLTHPNQTYFALGSPLTSFDLQRVSITTASSVIVLVR
ncbi:hypothetical protein DYB38_011450, partial [Aphanomyces astaci]